MGSAESLNQVGWPETGGGGGGGESYESGSPNLQEKCCLLNRKLQ
jgi:hypothetical protein